MKLNKLETEILIHRLEVPDCLMDVWNDSNTEQMLLNEAIDITDDLIQQCKKGSIGKLNEKQRFFLNDAAEGSTFFASIDEEIDLGQMSKILALSYIKAAKSLGRKLGVIVELS